MKIRHYGSIGKNIGDHAAVFGLQEFISSISPSCHFDLRSIPERVSDKDCDLLLFGGGGLLSAKKSWFKRTEGIWSNINIRLEEISKPYIVFGVGMNTWRGFPLNKIMPDHGIEPLRRMSEEALYFGVRPDGTSDLLYDNFRICVEECAPPSFWAPRAPSKFPRGAIAFQITCSRGGLRFHGTTEKTVICAIVNAINRAKRLYDCPIVVVSHATVDDDTCNLISNMCECHFIPFDSSAHHTGRVIDFYSNCKLVVGMRGHSLIIPVGCGVPVVGISTYDKVTKFMERLDIQEFCVDVRFCGFEELLVEKIDSAMSRADQISSNILSSVNEMKHNSLTRMNKVFSVFN